ncbi:unnamed protein product [Cuscuta campestris]|uniref:Reverse transcriptase domain-containing protein n=1 Tax=Cuscuta campestris TaxID=132261 RepID=A0A484MNS3_9ASTE|nr:unnamed protein product [Cuscuta campestris]
MKLLFWNIRGITSSLHRLKSLIKTHSVPFLYVLESLVNCNKLQFYMLSLGFSHCLANPNNKIWIFWRDDILHLLGHSSNSQSTSCRVLHKEFNKIFNITAVYGKHSILERQELWHSLSESRPSNEAWLVGGTSMLSFPLMNTKATPLHPLKVWKTFKNVFPVIPSRASNLLRAGSLGVGIEGKGGFGEGWTGCWLTLIALIFFAGLKCFHLCKARSDHNPLLLECILDTPSSPKGFKVLNVWFSNPSFLTAISQSWNSTGTCGGMRGFSNKLKELKSAIRKWNKDTFGDIFQNLKKAEEEAITAELSYDSNPIESNREAWSQAMANLLLATKKETDFWKQKAQVRWMEKGDSNSKFFHSFVKGRRAKLTISQIKTRLGHTLKDAPSIKAEAVSFFSQTFSHANINDPQEILKFLPQVISEEDNTFITRLPSMEEVKHAVWELDPHSTCGPDGFNGEFFRKTWHILGKDLLLAAQEFFLGIPPPTAFGATTLALVPKIPNPQCFNDFWPISLSTFMSKVLSKLLAIRLKSFLPKLISMEQGAFQEGKDIADQILITGELHHSLDRKVNGGNIIIKVDMAKAFDRLSWEYLQGVLSAFGFSSHAIKILVANLKSTHFSILINGEPTGFFKMERGIKQGDPLSPILYILGVEGLSRSLNHHVNSGFITPFNAGRCPKINHLAFADDLILFTNGHFRNLLRIKGILESYLAASSQAINFDKSKFYSPTRTPSASLCAMERALNMKPGPKPFTYLGAPICRGKLKKEHCSPLINHFDKFISSWYSKALNPIGRLILIKHVLSSIPLHLMAVHSLPLEVIKLLHKKMASFL